MTLPRLLLLLLVLLEAPLRAEDNSADSEEIVALSPFEISSDSNLGYSSLAARHNPNLIDPGSANTVPAAPITITKRADALAVTFTLFNTGDKQEARNNELYASIEALRAAFARADGLRFEHREIRFASGNRSKLSIRGGNSTTSYASILIFADLTDGIDLVKTVKRIRDLTVRAQLAGQTKIADGAVGLYVKNPQQYRREILGKIFEDVEALKKSVGSDFEILLSGLNERVRTRVCSETDVELWVDYSFQIRSIRELVARHQKP